MYVLVLYDVSTRDRAGRRRLRKLARLCLDWGVRVQRSAYELRVNPCEWRHFRWRAFEILDLRHDSFRCYHLGARGIERVEQYGPPPPIELDDPLIF